MINDLFRSFLIPSFIVFALGKAALADPAVDACIEQWGKSSPFKKGATPQQVVGTSVKVLGLGKDNFEDLTSTEKPRLVLIKPSVNVLGKTVFRLMNPNGWYCFKSNTSVLGKIQIEAHCMAKIASSKDGGANVLGSDESEQGVTVLGTLRITRPGCKRSDGTNEEKKLKSSKEEVPAPVTVTVTSTATSTGTR